MSRPTILNLGLIGHPLKHSVSAVIHTAFLEALGIQGDYQLYDIAPEKITPFFQTLSLIGCRGLNVTLPYKIAVMPYLKQLDDSAKQAEAVNTIVRKEGSLIGYNTDITGFLKSLPLPPLRFIGKKKILILGSGGSARGVLAASIPYRPHSITIMARSEGSALDCLKLGSKLAKQHQVELQSIYWKAPEAITDLSHFDWVINTTPVGMAYTEEAERSPLSNEQIATLPKSAYIYDLVYRPLVTPLLKEARAQGYATQNGLKMLLEQARASFELWSGQKINEPQLEQAKKAVLAKISK
jgi:shikimate dehydrogenase